jgi:hypothetical protein
MKQFDAGQWIKPGPQFQLGCCECGLVHRVDFRIVDGQVQFRAYRDVTATNENRQAIAQKPETQQR